MTKKELLVNQIFDEIFKEEQIKSSFTLPFSNEIISIMLKSGIIQKNQNGTYSLKFNLNCKFSFETWEKYLDYYILIGDYPTVFELLDYIYDKFPEHIHLIRYYIFLLVNIKVLPVKLSRAIIDLPISEMKIDNQGYFSNKTEEIIFGDIQHYSLTKSFAKAQRLLKSIECKDYRTKAIKTLIDRDQEALENEKRFIRDLIKAKKYDELNTYLTNISKNQHLSKSNYYLSLLVSDLVAMKNSGFIFSCQKPNSYNVFTAILNQDYELARGYARRFEGDNQILMITNEIVNFICFQKHKNIIAPIIEALKNQDAAKARIELRNLLNYYNRSNFYNFFIYLIMLDKTQNDTNYTNFSYILAAVIEGKILFSELIKDYLEGFQKSLGKDNHLATIYYNLIDTLPNNLTINTSSLKEQLTSAVEKSTGVDTLRNDISTKINSLHREGRIACILDPMSKEMEEEVYYIVTNTPGFNVFTIIDKDGNYRLVITKHLFAQFDEQRFYQTHNTVEGLYNDRKYENCIDYLEKLIKFHPGVDKKLAGLFRLLGFSHIKSQYAEPARDYLIIADGLYRSFGIESDLKEIIEDSDQFLLDEYFTCEVKEWADYLEALNLTIEETIEDFDLKPRQAGKLCLYLANKAADNKQLNIAYSYFKNRNLWNVVPKNLYNIVKNKIDSLAKAKNPQFKKEDN